MNLAETLADVRLVLVVDVGGGTTDFTLIQVGIAPGRTGACVASQWATT